LINESTLDTSNFSLPSSCEQILSLTIFPSLQAAIVILCHTKWKATKVFSALILLGQVAQARRNSPSAKLFLKKRKAQARA
jgi:hypothetical protein